MRSLLSITAVAIAFALRCMRALMKALPFGKAVQRCHCVCLALHAGGGSGPELHRVFRRAIG